MDFYVLGTKYTMVFDVSLEEMPDGADGFFDPSTHTIKIADFGEVGRNTVKDFDEYRKSVMRHEIIHAFFYESGIWGSSAPSQAIGTDEMITDWFAIQSPKIFKLFSELDCI